MDNDSCSIYSCSPELGEISLAPWHVEGFVSKRRRSAKHPVEMPPVGDALQFVFAGVFELQPRARGEVFHRGAHENLPGACERADPRADVDREAANVVASEFDLTGVAPGADLQAELADGHAERLGAADGPGGPVEGRQQAVPGGVDVAAPVPFDLPARQVVMLGEEIGPAGVAELGQPLGGPDDVGEQDGRKDAVGAWPVPLAGEERLDLVGDRARVAWVR